ncbi:uncharacterized protein LOC111242836 isoform X1 [Varroa destructor]|uniref:Thyroglobulin type-1 domain-containing protein n=1 Tax=Varroa destructor TaxID=109461 RepID=A0A7M7IWF6_VARDE|nr:uncharacterized protein LOC111242836 isoform X1 [Varroa destructor]
MSSKGFGAFKAPKGLDRLRGYVCALKGDPAELEECRSKNKGKWCTCRRLADHVKPLIGRKLGMFLPKCDKYYSRLFDRKQCYNLDAECWCVNPKTGRMIEGTKVKGKRMNELDCWPKMNKIREEL